MSTVVTNVLSHTAGEFHQCLSVCLPCISLRFATLISSHLGILVKKLILLHANNNGADQTARINCSSS